MELCYITRKIFRIYLENIFHLVYQKKLVDLIPVSQISHLSFLEQNSRISFELQICTDWEVLETVCNLHNKSFRNDKIPVFIHKS